MYQGDDISYREMFLLNISKKADTRYYEYTISVHVKI